MSAAPHPTDLAPLLVALVWILVGARLGGGLFERLRLPAVLGELAAGILLGNLGRLGIHALEPALGTPALDVLAQLGVLFLLFQVGLDSDLARMMAVGASALLVATLGVIAPLVLGFAV